MDVNLTSGATTRPATFNQIEQHFRRRNKPEDVIHLGRNLLSIKEATTHGQWLSTLEGWDIAPSVAQKYMQVAIRFSALGEASPLVAAVTSQTQLLELLKLDDDELKALDAGGTVRGLHRDQIGALSVKALRAVLRSTAGLPPKILAKKLRAAEKVTANCGESTQASAPPLPPGVAPIMGEVATRTEADQPAADQDTAANPATPTTRHTITTDFDEALEHFSNTTYTLCKQTHRVSAVLRLMQSHYLGKGKGSIDLDDIQELTDLLIDTLPHHYHDLNDPLEEFDRAARAATKDAIHYGDTLNTLLEAMTVAARGDSTPEDISEAAGKVLDIANADPAYEPDWQTFVDVVESRGYVVSHLESHGLRMLPLVATPEMAKLKRKQDRAVVSLIKAAHQTTGASRQAPAGEGCHS